MKCSDRFKFTILFINSLLDTTSSLSFFLVHRAKRARHVNDHARDWRRETGEARKKRVTLFSFRAAALVSRVSRLRRSSARALPSLNLKKKWDCSQFISFTSRRLRWSCDNDIRCLRTWILDCAVFQTETLRPQRMPGLPGVDRH